MLNRPFKLIFYMEAVTKQDDKPGHIVILKMHNPFGLLSVKLLHALINGGYRYFVRQSYRRGLNPLDPIHKAAFLFTHYYDLPSATRHHHLIRQDPNHFLYDCKNADHAARLEIAAKQVPGYPVYTPLLEKPWQPSEKMAELIRKYIGAHLNWMPAREETVKADLFTEFGELFVNLNYRSHEIQVPLADIEKS
jgi:hypothetical protein